MLNQNKCQPYFCIFLKKIKLIAFLLIICIMQSNVKTRKRKMKKNVLFMLLTLLAGTAHAEGVSYIEEMQSLGAVSGQGLACEAKKYDTFELLARAIMISKASSDAEQEKGMQAYNEYKANAFISKMKDGFADCKNIANAFDKQGIFKATLYGNGTIKMPDGTIIKPRHAYDATLVYKKEPNARKKYIDMYQKQTKKIHSDPAYQKALRERQMQDGF